MTKIDFVGHKRIYFTISITLIIISVAVTAIFGLIDIGQPVF